LIKDPSLRIGSHNDATEIRQHPFFNGIDFEDILSRKIAAPIKPKLKDKTDVSYFDDAFTNEDARQELDSAK
jgi:Protein kinase C terminal domain